MDKVQERELSGLEAEAVTDEFVPDQTKKAVPVQPPTAAASQLAGYIVMGVSMVCTVLAQKRGAHWVITEKEQGELHAATARVAEKYVSFDLNNPLYALAAVVGAIAVPRLVVELMPAGAATESEAVQDGD